MSYLKLGMTTECRSHGKEKKILAAIQIYKLEEVKQWDP